MTAQFLGIVVFKIALSDGETSKADVFDGSRKHFIVALNFCLGHGLNDRAIDHSNREPRVVPYRDAVYYAAQGSSILFELFSPWVKSKF